MVEVRFTRYETQPPRMSQVLLVDDNDRYASFIIEQLKKSGTQVTRVSTAAEAVEKLKVDGNSFDGIITDISMEGQLSGLKVINAARKSAFKGTITVATTGLDSRFGFIFNRVFLGRIMGCDYLIPKKPIKKNEKLIWIKGKN